MDKLVITHHHDDHMGAVNSLLNDFYVKEIVYSSVGSKYGDFKQAMSNYKTSGGYYKYTCLGAKKNQNVTFTHNGVKSQAMKIYGPRKTAELSITDAENNQSMVVSIFGYDCNMYEYNVVLMGDVKYAGLKEFMGKYGGEFSNRIWSIVQYGHHGVRQSDTTNELKMYNDYLKSWNYIATCDLNINGKYAYNHRNVQYLWICAYNNYYGQIKPSLENGMINMYGFKPGVYSFDIGERKGDICMSGWLLQESGVN